MTEVARLLGSRSYVRTKPNPRREVVSGFVDIAVSIHVPGRSMLMLKNKTSLTERSCQLNQESQARDHANLAQLSMTDDCFADRISLVTRRAMVAQEASSFHGPPVLKREMGAIHMLWGRAYVMEETREKVSLEHGCEMWEVCLNDCVAYAPSVHAIDVSQRLARIKRDAYSNVTLTVIPDTHAVIERSLRQRSLCVVKYLPGHLVVWHLHAVEVQLRVFLLIDVLERLRMTPWDSSPAMVGKLSIGVTARHRIGDFRVVVMYL
jgi:hypothetical protein